MTERQLRSVYNSARRTYDASYAMMVDDIMQGANAAAKRMKRRRFCYDEPIFQDIAVGVRRFMSFEEWRPQFPGKASAQNRRPRNDDGDII